MGSLTVALDGATDEILSQTLVSVWQKWLPAESTPHIRIETRPGQVAFHFDDREEHRLKLALAISRRPLELSGMRTGADFPTIADAFTDDGCALCKKVSGRLGLQREGGGFGWSAVREAAWWYAETGRIAFVHRFDNDARLVVHADDLAERDSWTLRAAGPDQPFVTVVSRGHFLYAIALGENALALAHRTDAGLVVSVTGDAGATWESHESAVPAESRFFAGRSRVFAVRESALRVSDDGGRTWRMLCERMRIAGGDLPPDRFAEGAGGRLWVAFYEDLAFSDDGGRTWTARALPFDMCVMSIVPGRARDSVGIFGERAQDDEHDGGVAALRSVDGGAHWSNLGGTPGDDHVKALALPSGEWLWSTLDEGTRTSSDEGATWEQFGAEADCACEEAPGTLLVASGCELLRVTRLR
jgi:hypothetical protein